MATKNESLVKFNKLKEALAINLGQNIGRRLTHESAQYILAEIEQANVYGFNEAVEEYRKRKLK